MTTIDILVSGTEKVGPEDTEEVAFGKFKGEIPK